MVALSSTDSGGIAGAKRPDQQRQKSPEQEARRRSASRIGRLSRLLNDCGHALRGVVLA
jgi:hypothetical protein